MLCPAMSYHAHFTEEETDIQSPHGLFCIPWLGCPDHSRGLAAFHLPAFAQPLPSKESDSSVPLKLQRTRAWASAPSLPLVA